MNLTMEDLGTLHKMLYAYHVENEQLRARLVAAEAEVEKARTYMAEHVSNSETGTDADIRAALHEEP